MSSPSAALRNSELTSSTVVSRTTRTVRSVSEPTGTGTRTEYPSSLPFGLGSTRPIALAALVVVGMVLRLAAQARPGSRCGRPAGCLLPAFSAGQQARLMTGTVVFRGAPSQPESASRSAGAAVPTGSPVATAQAMHASGRIRTASAGG